MADHFTGQRTRTSADLFRLHKDGRVQVYGAAAVDELPTWEASARGAVAYCEQVPYTSVRILLDEHDRLVAENSRLRQILASQLTAGGASNGE